MSFVLLQENRHVIQSLSAFLLLSLFRPLQSVPPRLPRNSARGRNIALQGFLCLEVSCRHRQTQATVSPGLRKDSSSMNSVEQRCTRERGEKGIVFRVIGRIFFALFLPLLPQATVAHVCLSVGLSRRSAELC